MPQIFIVNNRPKIKAKRNVWNNFQNNNLKFEKINPEREREKKTLFNIDS